MPKTLSVRLDDNTKNAADMLFNSMGTNTASAVRMFIYAAVRSNRLPSQKEIMANSTKSGKWLFDEKEMRFINPKIVAEIENGLKNKEARFAPYPNETTEDFFNRTTNYV